MAVFVRLVCRSRRYISAEGMVAVCCRRSGCFDCIPGGTGRIEKTGKDTGVKKFGAELWASKKAGPLRVGAEGQPFNISNNEIPWISSKWNLYSSDALCWSCLGKNQIVWRRSYY